MSSSDKEAVLATTSIQVPTFSGVRSAVRKWLGPPAERASSGAEKTAEGGRRSALKKSEDPFLYYSCDQTRLSHLKAQAAPQAAAADPSPERKTRISFELHPDLLLEDMIGDDDAHHDDASLLGGDDGAGAQGCGDLRDVTKIDSLQELEMLRAVSYTHLRAHET